MSGEKLKEITDDAFKSDVLESPNPVIVDFWAPWCAPCKMLTPILEELSEEYEGKVVFGSMNVDDNPQTASKYGIVAIPTLLFIKDGNISDQHSGLLAKEPLKQKIDGFLS